MPRARKWRDDGSGLMGACAWCGEPCYGSQGGIRHYPRIVALHRGECGELYTERILAAQDRIAAGLAARRGELGLEGGK